MKHLWALLSTLVLTSSIVVTGVAAGAAPAPVEIATAAKTAAGETDALSSASVLHGFYWSSLSLPQDIVPGLVLLPLKGTHSGSRGTRSDRAFFEISSTGSNDVPQAALRAYRHAAMVMAIKAPSCRISWTLLAAIGRVETDHGRFGGAQLGSDGISRPEIRGPQLNGAGAFAAIKDSDKGALDHDTVWDRAVGQMQFLPETWASVARDGDGDGRMNPDDIDDAALGSAVYLCGAGGSLAGPAGAARAAFRYNHSDYYVQLVLSFQAGYVTGVFALPSPPPPPAKTVPTAAARPRHASRPRGTKAATEIGKPVKVPAAAPSTAPKPKPAPRPTSKPTPTPTGPQLVQVEGTWNACNLSYCLGSTALDLGRPGQQADRADADFDGDGTAEPNRDEFEGLVGKTVSLRVERNLGGFVVYVINGHGFRNADGSFARAATQAAASATVAP